MSWIRIHNTWENDAKKQNYFTEPNIYSIAGADNKGEGGLQVLVSGTMEMESVFRLAEFVTGRAVVTSGHQMVNLEQM